MPWKNKERTKEYHRQRHINRTDKEREEIRKQQRKNVRRLQKEKRDWLYEQFGGKCSVCGYKRCRRALCFHHLSEKNPKLIRWAGYGRRRASLECLGWDELLKEAEKLVLVCANCHYEIHDGLIETPLQDLRFKLPKTARTQGGKPR